MDLLVVGELREVGLAHHALKYDDVSRVDKQRKLHALRRWTGAIRTA